MQNNVATFSSLTYRFIRDTTKNVLTLWKNCHGAITSSSKVKIRLIMSKCIVMGSFTSPLLFCCWVCSISEGHYRMNDHWSVECLLKKINIFGGNDLGRLNRN